MYFRKPKWNFRKPKWKFMRKLMKKKIVPEGYNKEEVGLLHSTKLAWRCSMAGTVFERDNINTYKSFNFLIS